MGVIGGCSAAVDGEKSIREWRVSYKGHLQGWTSSGLSCGTARVKGVKDWVGWYRGYGYFPANFPGDSITFKGSIDGSVGATGTALISDVIIRGSVERGGPIEYMVRFGGNGALTLGASVATDSATPVPGEAIDMKVAVDGTDESDCRDVMLHMSRALKPYSSSDTAGIMKRVNGRFDAVVEYHTYEDTPSDFLAGGRDVSTTSGVIKVYCTSTLFWELTNMRWDDLEDYGTDLGDENELSDPPGGLCRWRLDANQDGAGVGTVKTPEAVPVTKWP